MLLFVCLDGTVLHLSSSYPGSFNDNDIFKLESAQFLTQLETHERGFEDAGFIGPSDFQVFSTLTEQTPLWNAFSHFRFIVIANLKDWATSPHSCGSYWNNSTVPQKGTDNCKCVVQPIQTKRWETDQPKIVNFRWYLSGVRQNNHCFLLFFAVFHAIELETAAERKGLFDLLFSLLFFLFHTLHSERTMYVYLQHTCKFSCIFQSLSLMEKSLRQYRSKSDNLFQVSCAGVISAHFFSQIPTMKNFLEHYTHWKISSPALSSQFNTLL